MDKILAFGDTETTGLSEPRLIELAYSINGDMRYTRAKNPVPIDIEAMAVHHITPGMLEHLPYFAEHPDYALFKKELEENVFVAHNAPFDIGVLKEEGIDIKDFICTKKVAMHLYPDLSQYKLQYLRYHFEIYLTQEDSVAHSADGDVRVLIAVFEKLKENIVRKYATVDPIEKMIEMSKVPVLLQRMPFGKHRGKIFSEINRIDRKYIEWLFMSVAEDKDPDFQHTITYWMGRKSV